jgi:ADP-ribosylglycohydrolase
MTTADTFDKILGSLAGACIGDALGAPTEQRSPEEIRELFGGRIQQFYEPPDDSPFSHGQPAGHITDDSSLLLLIAEQYIAHDGEMTPEIMADVLLTWSEQPEYFPHFAGPSTRAAIERIRNGGDPWLTGKQGRLTTEGTSNGGAMRVAVAGIVRAADVAAAVTEAHLTCIATHNTNIGVAGAAAVAAAVSEAMRPDADIIDIIRAAKRGAELGAVLGSREGRHVAGPSVAARIDLACELAIKARNIDDAIASITALVGTGLSAAEACPAAIGFFLAAGGDPYLTAVAAASAGDDSDTVGCMAAAIAGAFRGSGAIPTELYTRVSEVNGLDLARVARGLTPIAQRSLDRAFPTTSAEAASAEQMTSEP